MRRSSRKRLAALTEVYLENNPLSDEKYGCLKKLAIFL